MSLQALMPPCAQTECDRLTGTIENRSTVTPSSASLMVHASPASPPPTTITRFLEGKAIVMSVVSGPWSVVSCRRLGRLLSTDHGQLTTDFLNYHISLPITSRLRWMNFT